MHGNFCSQCGERLNRKGWRSAFGGSFCDSCSRRLGGSWKRPAILGGLIAIAAFSLGRYLRPAPPPLVIQRLANSPLSDLPVNAARPPMLAKQGPDAGRTTGTGAATDDAVYICGARTKKGTPCHRRVHLAGERCFQHKGMPAILPLEKLKIDPSK